MCVLESSAWSRHQTYFCSSADFLGATVGSHHSASPRPALVAGPRADTVPTLCTGISLPAQHSSDIPRRKPATNNRCRRPSSPAFSRRPVADRSGLTAINSRRPLVSRSSGKIMESPTRFHSERLVCRHLPPSSEEPPVPFQLLHQLDLLSSVTLTLSSAFIYRVVLSASVDH